MNNLKIVNKLGFKTINNDLGRECESVISFLLDKFLIDDAYNIYYVFNKNGSIDPNKVKKVCRGFGYNNESFDFITIIDQKTQNQELIVKPTLQKNFANENFGELFHIVYNYNDEVLKINKLSKEKYDLSCENYNYVRDSKSRKLVLIGKKTMFDGTLVSNYDKRINDINDLRMIYQSDKYLFDNIVKPFSEKLVVTSKDINAVQKLYLNGKDTLLVLRNGTVIYDINSLDLERPFSLEKQDIKAEKSLIECLNEYYKIDEQFTDLNSYIKRKNR